MARNLTTLVLLVGLGVAMISGTASAVQVIGRDYAEFAWEQATGPVDRYGVFVSRDGAAFPESPELFVSQPKATVGAEFGQVLTICVAAFDAAGNRGPMSLPSEPIEFLVTPEPDPDPEPAPAPEPLPQPDPEPLPDPDPEPLPTDVVYFEDFQSYRGHEDPDGWFDTGLRNSLDEAPDVFETFEFGDGNVALGTSSDQVNIHSHYRGPGSALWHSYEYSGRMYIEDETGGIGVTLFSDYPNSDSYYRLRRFRSSAFHIANHPHGEVECHGETDTGVVPRSHTWYWFRLQAFPGVVGTRLRAMVWDEADVEPSDWQVDCVDDRASAFVFGSPGVWSMGSGAKYWDDLEVRLIDLGPGTEPDDRDDWVEPDLGDVLYFEDFEQYGALTDPDGWLDTDEGNSTDLASQHFAVLSNGYVSVYAAISRGVDVHSHFVAEGSAFWDSYEFSGRLGFISPGGDLGVTLYSDYPNSDSYYRLGASQGGSFRVSARGRGDFSCDGAKDTGVISQPDTAYLFRFQAYPDASGTRLRAKVWIAETPEPEGWQADCVDSSPDAFQSGAPGLWSSNSRVSYWDDLEIRAIEP